MAGLTVKIDTAEPRVLRDRLAVNVTGGQNGIIQWDCVNSSNIWLDLVTYTAILLPVQLHPDWQTTDTAPYNRLRSYDYSIPTPSSWQEANFKFNGDVYMYGLNVDEALTTLQTWERNQGFFFSYFSFGQNAKYIQLMVRMGNVGLAFWSDGFVQIFKPVTTFVDFIDTNFVGSGSITEIDNKYFQTTGSKGKSSDLMTGQAVDVIVLPWRHRELLVVSNRGGGFSFAFEDITQDEENPEITSPGTMSWYVPYSQPEVQAAPLRYSNSGYLISYARQLREIPELGASHVEEVYYDLPGYGVPPTVAVTLVDPTDVTLPFNIDGVNDTLILRVNLTADGTNTPFVYGASTIFGRVTDNTNAANIEIQGKTVTCDLNVPEGNSAATCMVKVNDVDVLSATVAKLKTVGNRPIEISLDGKVIFYGRTGAPEFTEREADKAVTVAWECQDPSKSFEFYQILDPTPFDSLNLQAVLQDLATMPGYDVSEMDIEAFDFELPTIGQSANSEYSHLPEPGDTVSSWISQLYEKYAKHCITGWYPSATGRKYLFKSPSALGVTPSAVVFLTMPEAYTYLTTTLGYSAEKAWKLQYKYVARTFKYDTFEVEGNDIRVTGWDSRLDRAFQRHWENVDSKVPSTAPAARPDDWLGEPRRVSYFLPEVPDTDTLDYVLGILRQRVGTQVVPAELECEMLFKSDNSPVWKGDVVTVTGIGDFRVRSLKMRSVKRKEVTLSDMSTVEISWFPTTYTLEKLP